MHRQGTENGNRGKMRYSAAYPTSAERIEDFSPNLFWDADPADLDFSKHRKYVVQRILERGTVDDLRLAFHHYGLGDVIAQTGQGLVLRTKSGAPGIGEIKSFRQDVFVAYKTFSSINTADIIRDSHHKQILSEAGLKYLELFEKEPTVENFLSFSNKFSNETKLMSDDVKNLVDYFNSSSDILGSSMAMLGNTVFAFAYDEDVFKKLDIDDLHICELNNMGIVYD